MTTVEQLSDYNYNAWPHVRDEDEEKAKQRLGRDRAEAERRIRENGGLTAAELQVLHFVRKDEEPINDI